MIIGTIGVYTTIQASGYGLYTEEELDSEYPSLIDQTRRDIQHEQDVETYEEDNNNDYEDNEDDDNSEAPMNRQIYFKKICWLQSFLEKNLMRLMGMRV